MANTQAAAMLPREITDGTCELHHKPGAKIHYNFVQGTEPAGQDILIVFLNGLMTDKTTWFPTMTRIINKQKESGASIPFMIAYDRYGQGLTEDRDPQDEGREPGHGHNVADAAADLYNLIQQLKPDASNVLLVGNSIGGAIMRLYAHEHPVAGVLMLDSVLANSNFDFYPDPDAVDFDKNQLPADADIDVLRQQRAKIQAIFHPSVPNKEGLSRRDLPSLLPHSGQPKLKGSKGAPFVTVVGHEFDAFAQESHQMLGAPLYLTQNYTNPFWHKYNEGLVRLTDADHGKGPLQAPGCGHFIQRDNPDFVVGEILELLGKIQGKSA